MCSRCPSLHAAAEVAEHVVTKSGVVVVSKVLDPLKDEDFVKIVTRLARELERKRRGITGPAVRAAIKSLDVDWEKLTMDARRAVVQAANRAIALADTRALPTIRATLETRVGDVAVATKKSMVRSQKVKIGTTLTRQDKKVIRAIARHGVVFKNERKRRSKAFERIGTTIIEDGLKKGLRIDVISKNLKAAAKLVHFKQSEHYMRIVASQAVNSGRIYSELRGLKEAGFQEYMYYAVMDERTCPICELLHELRFRIDNALDRYDKLADSDPGDVYEIKPWASLGRDPETGKREVYVERGGERHRIATVEGRGEYSNVASLPTMDELGISYPPAHGLCRCTIIAA